MGKDYDVAVMTGGFVGVMLRNTANAIANVESLNEKVGL
jgi:sodium--glutamate symport carrier gltS